MEMYAEGEEAGSTFAKQGKAALLGMTPRSMFSIFLHCVSEPEACQWLFELSCTAALNSTHSHQELSDKKKKRKKADLLVQCQL